MPDLAALDPLDLVRALGLLCGLLALAGAVQGVIGAALTARFARARRREPVGPRALGVTVLKPLFGAEPLLEEALVSLCQQDHAALQIVCGVQDPADLAIGVVRRVMAQFPERDITLIVDATAHGRNRKVANLINMYRVATHDIVVIADSDVHAEPDYVGRLLTALERPGVGLVTTAYSGRPASHGLAGLLGASGISHGFLPGALMARGLGRQDCLGATMALRRETLEAIGGLRALSGHVADDHMLGLFVQRLGLDVALATTVPATTVPETRLRDLYRHELRWSRTIASFVPVTFALSAVQYPLVWAGLSVLMSGAADWALGLFAAIWALRAATTITIDRLLGLPRATGMLALLLPLRDALSVLVVVASYTGTEVEWRGQLMRVQRQTRRLTSLETLSIGTEPL